MEKNSMGIRFFFIVILPALFYVGGCAQNVERIGPQGVQGFGDPYFRPKRVYAVGVNEAWDLTIKGLSREGISLEMVDKEAGLIRTDYQNLSAWERGKCEVRFSPEPQHRTFIYIRCSYEGRKDATEPFRDFSNSSPLEAMKAENELYRKIEPYILPFEGVAQSPEAASARVQPAPAPAPSEQTPSAKAEAAPPPKAELISPPTGFVSTPPAAVEVRPQAGTTAPGGETPPVKAVNPSPSTMATPKRAETIGRSSPVCLITVADANVRLAPSIQSKIIWVLKKGERVERIGESGVWTKVKLCAGEVAWVHRDFLEEMKPGAEMSAASASPDCQISPLSAEKPSALKTAKPERAASKDAAVASKFDLATKAVTKMRESPSATSKVVLVLKKGREVEKIGESGEYSKVRLSWGDTGWVLTRSLQRGQ